MRSPSPPGVIPIGPAPRFNARMIPSRALVAIVALFRVINGCNLQPNGERCFILASG
ncbi:hypothetical protein IVB18_13050 [Bradyrhizobium sp. 186]|uniref:hypothetical protein n=1 Tax=Bradyrhizobium sp. 186 TaxID=2782654 RepID=UPI002000EB59|nr:hypothetical protein [Bradyrhizobium sp. 186]UPK38111.1 hypothetical protein IVB18_13050 [Bradyrhizobium sp. 186]